MRQCVWLLCLGLSSRSGTPGEALPWVTWGRGGNPWACCVADLVANQRAARKGLLTSAALGAVPSRWAVAAGRAMCRLPLKLVGVDVRLGLPGQVQGRMGLWVPLLAKSTCSAGLIWAFYLRESAGPCAHTNYPR